MADLIVQGATKRYGTLVALDSVSAHFRGGEIHAVVGENGAGKSTLMGVLTGFVTPDAGSVTLDSQQIPLGKAFECKRLGIEMIHQHFTLVPAFSVLENLALGRVTRLNARLDAGKLAARATSMAATLGWSIDPSARVGDLPVGTQQRVEILKALGGEASILVFDEPTAVLAPAEVDDLFRVLRVLRDSGKTVILIAHKLSEVVAISDRVTVLRRGKFIATSLMSETTTEQISDWMVGGLPERGAPGTAFAPVKGLNVRGLRVRGDRGNQTVDDITFEIQRGEVLGIGGVDGNGQVELAESLAGVRDFEGTLVFDGMVSPGIGYVPQDRHRDALALNMSVQDNLLITGHRKESLNQRGLLNLRAIQAWAKELIQRFSIKVERPSDLVGSLSGGNQQKVVVSRALESKRDLLIFVNPTRGLDLGATQFVHEQIRAARAYGAAIALITTDLDELYALSDRTMFLSKGKLLADAGAASLVGGPA